MMYMACIGMASFSAEKQMVSQEVSMAQMVRKQIYIAKRQEQMLKRLARARGVSEAELIREAIDRQAAGSGSPSPAPDPEAFEEVVRFALARRRHGSTGQSRKFNREEVYAERLSRFEAPRKRG
jgi:fructose-1,6-bisphosphatase/inositol monophosphatase family enzyme